ncbi:hypothetical protein [Chryseobacterium sp.]|uniref:hypothetical protein n=1 Tax=Chryseobacterium sp. TaxID=1871047 RepID=UPI0011CBB670|nr:hypothetical protein [Chryseobacterium sp.]TXF79468.1 hypothetical protein FUA25_03530 [Chryseobacterium sp.]
MLELGKLYLPTVLAYDPDLGKIFFNGPEPGTDVYSYMAACTLVISFSGPNVYIDYSCDNLNYLSDQLQFKDGCIAKGRLDTENFEEIQKRALDNLAPFMVDKG